MFEEREFKPSQTFLDTLKRITSAPDVPKRPTTKTTEKNTKHEPPKKLPPLSSLDVDVDHFLEYSRTYGLKNVVKQIEKRMVEEELSRHAGHISSAAQSLKTLRTTFTQRIVLLGISKHPARFMAQRLAEHKDE